MAKFYPVVENNKNEGGFSDWIQPASIYKMACCDCGLVHDMRFRVMRVKEDLGNGYLDVRETASGKFVVQFQARRNERSTGQMRRHKKP